MPRSGCAAWETTGFDGVYKYNRAWRTDDTAWRCSLDSQEEGGRLTKACAKPPTLFVRRCTRPDGWRVLRIGPIRAQGQDTKHALGMSNLLPAQTCVEASVLAPVEEDGALLGEPPIVQHHVHVIQHTSIFEDMRARGYPLFDRQGQRFHYHPQWADHRHGGQCDARRGGATCLNRSYPAGFGQLLAEAANIDLELIEMGAGGVDVPAEFWYEASFRYCQAARVRRPAARTPAVVACCTRSLAPCPCPCPCTMYRDSRGCSRRRFGARRSTCGCACSRRRARSTSPSLCPSTRPRRSGVSCIPALSSTTTSTTSTYPNTHHAHHSPIPTAPTI